MRRSVCLVVLLTLLAASVALGQNLWNPTGLYSGDFIAVKQCQSNSGAYYMASTGPNVYRTGDSGVTWTSVSAQFGGNNVYCFASWTQTLQYYTIAGTSAGLYRTNDGGLTWSPVAGFPSSLTVNELFVSGNNNLLAGTNDGLYFSGTYGATWSKLTTPTATSVYSFSTYMISGQQTIYCGTSDGVWVSAYPSYGASWSELNNASTDAKTVRSLVTSGSNLVAAVWDGATGLGLYKSPRSTAWAAANTGLGNLNVNAMAIATNLYAATDNGLFESSDGAGSWHDYSMGLPSQVVKYITPVVSGAFCAPQGGGIYKKGAPILPPALVSPANNGTGVAVPTTLTWNYPVGNPTFYDVQYSTSPTFASGNVMVSNVLGTSTILTNLNPLKDYYWHVRASIGGSLTGYSATFKFTTADFAAPPTTPTSITFAPASPVTTDNITPTGSGSTDPNVGDTVSYEYEWAVSNNGGATYSAWGHPARVVTADETIRGQMWKCRAKATDGVLSSGWYVSPSIVTIANSAPSAPNSIAFNPAAPTTDQDITPTASGAIDPDGESVTYEYEWAVSFDSGASFSGWIFNSPVLRATATEVDEQWKCRSRASDGTTPGPWYEGTTILTILPAGAVPTAPTGITFSSLSPTTSQDVSATASGSTGDPFTYYYEWSVSTNSGGTWSAWGFAGATLPASLTTSGQLWKCRARADGASGSSAWYYSPATIVIDNAPPTPPTSAAISPLTPNTDADLTASALGSHDPEGQPVSYEYEWRSNDGTGWTAWGRPGDTILAADTTRDQQWLLRARASDGLTTSAWFELTTPVTILNSAPTMPTIPVIAPASPSIGDDLTITAGGSTDADGDAISYTVEWWVSTDGGASFSKSAAATSNNGQTLLGAATDGGQQWVAKVRASDGSLQSAWAESVAVTIGANHAPTVPTTVGINPLNPDTSVDLTGTADGATDADGTTPTYEFEWRSGDGTTWTAWGTPAPTIPAADTTRGQQWQVRARATDGTATSAWVELGTPITIVNAVPTRPLTALINPTVPGKEDLTGVADGSTDADGDTLTYEYQWAKQDATGAYLTKWVDNPGEVLPAATVNFGDTWQVRARAFDGTAYSVWKAHKTVKIVRMVSTISPAAGAVNVPVTSPIDISFRWAVDQLSVNRKLRVYRGTTLVSGSAKWLIANQKVRFVPTTALLPNTAYQVRLASGILCTSGRVLGWAEEYNFQTAGAAGAGAVTVAAAPTAGGAQLTVNLSSAATVRTVICNIAGRVVAELPEQDLPSGVSSLLWNGKSTTGSKVPAGSYLVKVMARGEGGTQTCAITPLALRR